MIIPIYINHKTCLSLRFEDLISKELKRLMNELSSYKGKDVDPRPIIENSIGLLVSTLVSKIL